MIHMLSPAARSSAVAFGYLQGEEDKDVIILALCLFMYESSKTNRQPLAVRV